MLVLRKSVPLEAAPENASVCVIPRDAVPKQGLAGAVADATFQIPRAMFTKESWVLEPKPVMELLGKIKRNSVDLADYIGAKPYRGVTTGFNDAFFINAATRETLIREDPNCETIIRPYLRGQDIERWYAPWKGLWMIFSRRGIEIEKYPSIKNYLNRFRTMLEPKPDDWKPQQEGESWAGRKTGTYAWYEIQDSTEYWQEFANEKIIYQAIQFYPSYAIDLSGMLLSNKAFFIPSSSRPLLCVLNSPIGWWVSWRHYMHMKDEALSNDGVRITTFPIPLCLNNDEEKLTIVGDSLITLTNRVSGGCAGILDWLHYEFGLDRPGSSLSQPHELDAEAFAAAVRKALPKSRKLSASDIGRLKQEHSTTVEPMRRAAQEARMLERRLSDLVNAAYNLTPEDIALMWESAPPRMPFSPADRLS